MKSNYLFKQPNYLTFRTAIEEEEFIFTYNYDKESGVYSTDYGFGLDAPKETEQTNPQDLFAYRRNYTWNERNLLTKSSDKNYTVHYRYGEDGQRALKYTEEGRSETLYFNNFFTIHIPIYDKDNPQGLRVHKHIFVGNSRLVTAMTHTDNHGDNDEQKEKRYYYHSDHLGSAQFVTDWRGKQYEHIEYTPYGELWVEETAPGIDKLPFRFTGKELDEETGLYYYGARYLDPKYSRWLSGDPALNDYIPKAPIDDEAKKHNENLPGMGGVFNIVNLHLYHYAGNNPVKYIDPDGENIAFFVNPELAGGNGHTSLYFQDVKGQWYKFDQGAAGEPSSGSGGIGYLFSYLPAGVSIEKVDKLPDGIEEIQTTLYQDYLISNNASEVQKAHNSGKVDYQLCSNSCTDAAVETVNDSGSGIKIPNPATTIKPNSWYKNEYKPWLKQNKDQTKHTPYGPYPLDYYKQLQNKERDIDVNK